MSLKTSNEVQNLYSQIEKLGGELTLLERENKILKQEKKELYDALKLLLGIYDGGAILTHPNRKRIEDALMKINP